MLTVGAYTHSIDEKSPYVIGARMPRLCHKSAKQKELTKIQNDLSNLKEKELNSKFIKEQKEKIIDHFKNFTELNYDIVNSFIDYIEIGEKFSAAQGTPVTDEISKANKNTKSQDVIIHWNF